MSDICIKMYLNHILFHHNMYKRVIRTFLICQYNNNNNKKKKKGKCEKRSYTLRMDIVML